MLENYNISVIIPFLNESRNLSKLVSELNNYIPTLNIGKIEILFVDDGSEDDSFEVLKGLKFISYDVRIIRLSRNFGSHSALQAGVLKSKGNFVVFMCADLQDPLNLILELYNKIKEGNDIAWAERRNTHSGFMTKIFSRMYAKMMQVFVIKSFPQKGFDVVMFNKKVKDELNQKIELNSSIFMQILFLGFRQGRIIYDKQPRKYGKSKWILSKKIKIFIDSFIAFSYFPIRFVSVAGSILSIIGIIWIIYIVLRTIFVGDLVQGWPTLIAIMLLGFGITNISLSIIAEYLWRTLDFSRRRKAFIIDEIIDIPGSNRLDCN